jgi:hypothetical protein
MSLHFADVLYVLLMGFWVAWTTFIVLENRGHINNILGELSAKVYHQLPEGQTRLSDFEEE